MQILLGWLYNTGAKFIGLPSQGTFAIAGIDNFQQTLKVISEECGTSCCIRNSLAFLRQLLFNFCCIFFSVFCFRLPYFALQWINVEE